MSPAAGIRVVAFLSDNTIANAGKAPWKRDTGLPSVWILAMFAPSPDARVVVPFETGAPLKGSPIVNDAYFGKVPSERLAVHEDKGFLVFTCDGKQRGKIGLGPARAKPVLGSYSARAKLLTVVQYDKPKASAPYVNSMWERQKAPYAGDVVNSYNDGSPAPGKPPLGGFYEIETSSPAAELAPGGSSPTSTARTTSSASRTCSIRSQRRCSACRSRRSAPRLGPDSCNLPAPRPRAGAEVVGYRPIATWHSPCFLLDGGVTSERPPRNQGEGRSKKLYVSCPTVRSW